MEARPNPSEWIVVESGKLEAITDTIHNLKHFEEKTENKFFGKSRLYHFEFETSTGEKRYAQFFQERMNQKTINLVCNHKTGRGRRVKKCDARITVTHKLDVEKYHTDLTETLPVATKNFMEQRCGFGALIAKLWTIITMKCDWANTVSPDEKKQLKNGISIMK